MRRHAFFPALATLLLGAGVLYAQEVPENKDGRQVVDLAGLLSPAERDQLEQRLIAYGQQTSNEVAILIVKAIPDGLTIQEYALKVEEAWKIGKKGKDNGVFLLIEAGSKRMQLDMGYGLEGAITDNDAFTIMTKVMGPHFREGRYAEGLNAGIDAIIKEIGGEYKADPKPQPKPAVGIWIWVVIIGYLGTLVLAFFIGGWDGVFLVLRITVEILRVVAVAAGKGGGSSSSGKSFGGGRFGGGGASARW
jgi:uncharacterized protein